MLLNVDRLRFSTLKKEGEKREIAQIHIEEKWYLWKNWKVLPSPTQAYDEKLIIQIN